MLIRFYSGKFVGKLGKSNILSSWLRNGVKMVGPRYNVQVGDLSLSHVDYNDIGTLIPITKKEIINE